LKRIYENFFCIYQLIIYSCITLTHIDGSGTIRERGHTPEEEMLLELLLTLIKRFEETHYSIPRGTPNSILMHLMDACDITPEALVEVIGSSEVVGEIVTGKRSINKAEAKALAAYFNVDISLFT
jgi:HTH-type transcriptional regulator/antitoxin HigA